MNTELIKAALDALSLALVEHNHNWTLEERTLYEDAIKECVRDHVH